jgi:hypothetical protein
MGVPEDDVGVNLIAKDRYAVHLGKHPDLFAAEECACTLIVGVAFFADDVIDE